MPECKCGPFPQKINKWIFPQYSSCSAHDDFYELMIQNKENIKYRKAVDKELLVDLISEGAPISIAVGYYVAIRICGGINIWLKRKFRKDAKS